jgi:hypothetical protein
MAGSEASVAARLIVGRGAAGVDVDVDVDVG